MDILELRPQRAYPPGTPPLSPLEMPAQDFFGHHAGTTDVRRPMFRWQTLVARLFVFFGTLTGASYGVREISMVIDAGGTTLLEYALFLLFTLTFSWIVFAACTAIAGFAAGLLSRGRNYSRQTDTRDHGGRTVILVPVYDEDPDDVFARIEAMAVGLSDCKPPDDYEFFILSDTRNPDIWVEEEIAVSQLRRTIGPKIPIWYRRRPENSGRKAGNIADFVRTWGGRYEFMVILDADSLMTAKAINALVDDIRSDPGTALVQTAPKLINGSTMLARSQQFANQVYGSVFARGLASWQGSNGNYWGHNAIIRVQAFAGAAGLPALTGRPPFGGEILSHDFVEAALLRRAGWRVRMRPDIVGSYEEMPQNLTDVSARDRRWLQGNLQHFRIVGAKGFTAISRLHFLIGIMSYLTSPLWLLLILVGLALSVQAHFIRPEYFTDAASLFPMWPRFDTERMLNLFFVTLGVLFTPKLLGFIDTILRIRRLRRLPALALGFVTETIFAALVAPIMMLTHTRHFANILAGGDSGWKSQTRTAEISCSRQGYWRRYIGHTAAGTLLSAASLTISIDIFFWMAPILAGLVFAIPIASLADTPVGVRARSAIFPDQTGALDAAGQVLQERHHRIRAKRGKTSDNLETGLHKVLTDESAYAAHDLFLEEQQPVRGKPNPFAAIAAVKIGDADHLHELMTWLCRNEQVAILSDRSLLKLAGQLRSRSDPGSQSVGADSIAN